MEIKIGDIIISSGDPPLIIPEIGINHEGNLQKAKDLITAAASAGAKCVKFQCHIPEEEMHTSAKKIFPSNGQGKSIYEIIERVSFNEEEEAELKSYSELHGLVYLSTPFSVEAVRRLGRLGVRLYKIGSGEVSNPFILEEIGRTGKPVIMSTGMASSREIAQALEILKENQVILLHCVSLYPTPLNYVNLERMQHLQKMKPLVGYSDHSEGIEACLGAVARGACVIEKHFTGLNNYTGPDAECSMDFRELKELIERSHKIWQTTLPNESPHTQAKTAKFAHASLVTTKDIPAGEFLTKENVTAKRPAGGISPWRFMKKLKAGVPLRAQRLIPKGSLIRKEDV